MRSIVIALSFAACVSAPPTMAQTQSPVAGPSGLDVSPACQSTCDAFDFSAIAPLNPTIQGPNTFAERNFAKGIELLEKREFARASVQLGKAANREKKNAVFQYWAGGSNLLAGNYESAEQYLSCALQAKVGLSAEQEATAQKMIADLNSKQS